MWELSVDVPRMAGEDGVLRPREQRGGGGLMERSCQCASCGEYVYISTSLQLRALWIEMKANMWWDVVTILTS